MRSLFLILLAAPFVNSNTFVNSEFRQVVYSNDAHKSCLTLVKNPDSAKVYGLVDCVKSGEPKFRFSSGQLQAETAKLGQMDLSNFHNGYFYYSSNRVMPNKLEWNLDGPILNSDKSGCITRHSTFPTAISFQTANPKTVQKWIQSGKCLHLSFTHLME